MPLLKPSLKRLQKTEANERNSTLRFGLLVRLIMCVIWKSEEGSLSQIISKFPKLATNNQQQQIFCKNDSLPPPFL